MSSGRRRPLLGTGGNRESRFCRPTSGALTMIDREIRAMLRGATAAQFLHGWQGPHLAERSYCLTPKHADPMERPRDYVIGYCQMLADAGVQPLYRDSEPLW